MKSALSLMMGFLLEAILPFVRTIALARLLPQEQFGIALTVLITITIVEMCCDLGLPQSAVRGSSNVSSRPFFGTLHTIAFVRAAVMIGLIWIVLSVQRKTLDNPFGADVFYLAVMILGLRAFENLSLKQHTLQYSFWRETVLISGSQIIWTIVTIASAMTSGRYTCMLYGMLAAAAWLVVISNYFAPHPWELAWNSETARTALRFGAPLMPNGAAAAVSISDRLVVGNFLGTAQVALYGSTVSLVTTPRSILWRFSTSVLVPHFVNLGNDTQKEREFHALWLLSLSVLVSIYAIGLIMFGREIIGLTLGAAYVPSKALMSLIAVNVFIKFMMLAPVPVAFARGQSDLAFIGALVAAAAIVPACLLLLVGVRSLEFFVLALNIAEGIGMVWYLNHTTRAHGLEPRISLSAVIGPLVGLGAFATWTRA